MIELPTILLILFLHFFADFVLQTRQMSLNKSTSNVWLLYHVSVYCLPFLLIFGVKYAIINGILHLATDWVSSRINTYYWNRQNYRCFFINVGLDQTLHFVALFSTYVWLF